MGAGKRDIAVTHQQVRVAAETIDEQIQLDRAKRRAGINEEQKQAFARADSNQKSMIGRKRGS